MLNVRKNMRDYPVIKFLFYTLLFFLTQLFGSELTLSNQAFGIELQQDTTQKKVYLEYADEVMGGKETYKESGKIIEERIRSAIGHVKFRDETTTVECDTAKEFLKSRKINLVGNVVITRDTVIIKGEKGYYYPNKNHSVLDSNVSLSDQKVLLESRHGEYFSVDQLGIFTDSVSLKDKETTIFCDSLVYYRREDHSIAINNVKIINQKDNIVITGDYGEHFNKLRHSFIEQEPVLTQTSQSSKKQIDTLIIKSLRMDAFRHPTDSLQRIEIQDSVRIWRGQLTAKAKDALYMLEQNEIVLTGDPLIWYDNTQMSGDSISIHLIETQDKQKQIDKIYLYNHAFLISADSNTTKKFDQLSGKNMVITFNSDSKLSRTDVYKEARSLYYLYDKEKPSGANLSSGDQINILFKENKVDRIRIIGGVEGKQFPEWMVEKEDLNLPYFKWRSHEKPIK